MNCKFTFRRGVSWGYFCFSFTQIDVSCQPGVNGVRFQRPQFERPDVAAEVGRREGEVAVLVGREEALSEALAGVKVTGRGSGHNNTKLFYRYSGKKLTAKYDGRQFSLLFLTDGCGSTKNNSKN